MIKIIFILAVVSLTSALHTQHFQQHYVPISHFQTQTANLYFQNQFNAIKSQVDYVYRALTINDTTTYKDLIAKTKQIQAGLNQIQNTLIKYNLTITLDDRICPKLTTFNRTELRRYITYTEVRQKWMQDYLASCLTCNFISGDIHKIKNLTYTYIGHLNNTLDGQYCNKNLVNEEKGIGMVNLNLSFFKNNLKANNWYYGSTTPSDYKIYIFKLSSTYNFTSCPIDKPFVKEHEQICFNCPQGSMFNLGKQDCDLCKNDQILNTQTASCEKCLGDKILSGRSLICKLCIISEGYIFSQQLGRCQKCNEKSYLDVKLQKCILIDCPITAPRFNRTTNLCEKCGLSQIINPNNISECLKTNYVGICHPQTPLYDIVKHTCEPCPQNTTYSQNSNECLPSSMNHFANSEQIHNQINITNVTITCGKDKPKYNLLTKSCQQCENGFQYNTKRADCIKSLLCGDDQSPDQQYTKCIKTSSTCSKTQVYILKINKCIPKSITCSQDQFYSKQSQTCISISSNCTRKEYYDEKNKKCKEISTKCGGNQIFNKNLSICEKLILCKDNEHYNSQLRICQKKMIKCLQNEYYDKEKNACRNYTRITSPFAYNLIITGSYSGYLSQYNEIKSKKDNFVEDCPLSTPFYQKTSKLCIACPHQTPFFNLQLDKCVNCNQKEEYNIITHKCDEKQSSSELLPPRISETISRINI